MPTLLVRAAFAVWIIGLWLVAGEPVAGVEIVAALVAGAVAGLTAVALGLRRRLAGAASG